jgi:hypothetical protein
VSAHESTAQVKDETGKRYGRLVVLRRHGSRKAIQKSGHLTSHATWFCVCDCGKYHVAAGNALRAGGTRSCGCLKREMLLLRWRQRILSRSKWRLPYHQYLRPFEIRAELDLLVPYAHEILPASFGGEDWRASCQRRGCRARFWPSLIWREI